MYNKPPSLKLSLMLSIVANFSIISFCFLALQDSFHFQKKKLFLINAPFAPFNSITKGAMFSREKATFVDGFI